MATNQPLKKNTATTLYLEVRAQADPTTFKSGPTIAAGDFKFSVDGGAYANLNTTPTASGAIITVALLAAETNGDVIKIKAEDVAGAEWVGRTWTFYTSTKQLDDLATAATLGAPTGLSIAADLVAIQADADNIQTRIPAALTVGGNLKADVEEWRASTPNALQSGRLDSYVGAMASSVIAAATFVANALDAVWTAATRTITGTTVGALDAGSFTSGAEKAFADALLARNAMGGSDGPAAESVAAAIAGGFMNMDITGGVLTVKYADGSTAFQQTLTRTAGLDAITHSA